jgi:hypothetical protein
MNFYTRFMNRLYLCFQCHYLRTDEYGNEYYEHTNFDPDIVKIILVFASKSHYLVSYFEWFDLEHCYEEFLSADQDISI